MAFSSLRLSEYAQRAAEASGFVEPTQVQAGAIPPALEGRDALAQARTGSGKTAAFGLAALDRLHSAPASSGVGPRCLILVPTRELAGQVAEAMGTWAKHWPKRLEVAAIYGGVGMHPQYAALRRGCPILVATPGRLLDHVDRGELRLDALEILVLDEADRLLQLGFKEELTRIISLLPEQRQNLFFSATFPGGVAELAKSLLRDPARINDAEKNVTPDTIVQRAIRVDRDNRGALLRRLLESEGWEQVMVFVATKRRAGNLARKLGERGISCDCLHGDLSQVERSGALEDFKRGRTRVLIATDVAGRGIDVERLACVVNFDLPRSTEDYGHRIGRTGRAGRTGLAVSFIGHEDEGHFQLIQKRHRLSIELEDAPGFERSAVGPEKQVSKAPVKGKRKSKKDKLREKAALESGDLNPNTGSSASEERPFGDANAPSPWAEAARRKREPREEDR